MQLSQQHIFIVLLVTFLIFGYKTCFKCNEGFLLRLGFFEVNDVDMLITMNND